MLKTRTWNLIKVYFKELYLAVGEWGTNGYTPGGAHFAKGYYVAVEPSEHSLVLRPGTKLKKYQERVEFRFEDGTVSSVCNRLIEKIETVVMPEDPLLGPLIRKDLTIINFRIPGREYPTQQFEGVLYLWRYDGGDIFVWRKRDSSIIKIKERKGKTKETILTTTFEVLTKKDKAKRFIKGLFNSCLIPPGREWMILRRYPTSEDVKEFGPF